MNRKKIPMNAGERRKMLIQMRHKKMKEACMHRGEGRGDEQPT